MDYTDRQSKTGELCYVGELYIFNSRSASSSSSFRCIERSCSCLRTHHPRIRCMAWHKHRPATTHLDCCLETCYEITPHSGPRVTLHPNLIDFRTPYVLFCTLCSCNKCNELRSYARALGPLRLMCMISSTEFWIWGSTSKVHTQNA